MKTEYTTAPVNNTYGINCGYRLPCGLCTRTNAQCPYLMNTYEITCSSSVPSSVVIEG